MADPKKPFRIALHQEGGMLNAYWAPIDSMEGAELVASCSLEILDDAPELQTAYYCFMQLASVAMCKSRLGVVPRSVEFTPDPSLKLGGVH